MSIRALVRKDIYFDSVTLMQISAGLKKTSGIQNALVGMATDYNVESLKRLGLYLDEFQDATPSDLLICIEADTDETADAGVALAEKLLVEKRRGSSEGQDYIPPTLSRAIEMMPGANIVLVSLPGQHAAREVRTSLEAGKHVMLFSDNVSLEEELELKELAVSKELLMMGPDCGTSIINGVPLAFANAVRRGSIGIVAASGTGLQEVSSIIHHYGEGVTQAIGVGGRDLSETIEGRMTILAVRALGDDPGTDIIVLISKPPHKKTLEKLFEVLKTIQKKIIVYFIGTPAEEIEKQGFIGAKNLEDAARKACEQLTGKYLPALVSDEDIQKTVRGIRLPGTYLRGLYSGGTLCDEAQRILQPVLGELYSNTPVSACLPMKDIYKSEGHCIMDLGDDDFTRGKAHPMIDPSERQNRIIQEISDKDVGIIIFDVVLGYGSHQDMATEIVSAIKKGREESGRTPVLAATICGTGDDPQDYDSERKILEDEGIKVFPSNASLSRFIKEILKAQ